MDAIAQFFTADHRRCDQRLADCEAALAKKDWQETEAAAAAFQEALLRHFLWEEEQLFPEIEEAAPTASGPTGVMRREHEQMRQLLRNLMDAVRAKDRETCLGELETLHLLNQQHNVKEEGILYPLADQALGPQARDLIEKLKGG